MALIECIPNVSEGRRAGAIEACARAIRESGAHLLDVSSDRAHNRTVYSFAGTAPAIQAAVLALFDRALAEIDLRQHSGVHPRIGAVDVVPFVPLGGTTIADCAALAKTTAAEVSSRHQLPIFLYEQSATATSRRNLEDIRRGGFEGLAAKLARPEWRPDFGPSAPHPTAGASVFGARTTLIAYNINLATAETAIAKGIAAAVRESSGGLPYVKAMGVALADRGIVQVSMNLTNYRKTSMVQVFDAVKREATRRGVAVLGSEIVGLVPADALREDAARHLQLPEAVEDQILETRLNRRDREPSLD